MKKILLITTMVIQAYLFGQTLPNGTFENWNSIPYNDPNAWNSGNSRDLQRMGVPSITRVPGFSGYAIRIQSNIIGPDTSDSYIINTNNPCSDPPQWTGGVPLTQQPTAITGYYRYNLLGNDTAIFLVIFRKNGVHIGDNFIKIKGTGSQSTFAPFSFSVTCAGTPDSVIFAAAPSNKKDNNIANNGSFIELDNIGFAGTSQTIPNGDFENWTAKSYDMAQGWKSWGNGVSKTTGSYAGSYAIKLETMNEMCGGVNPSGITTGRLTESNGPAGGQPYTNTTDTLKGYYKYAPVGSDTASVYINLMKNGINVGGGWKQLTVASNYVYFEVPIMSGFVPDTIRIDIQSSKWPTQQSNVGSILYLDNLSLKSQALGIFNNLTFNSNVYCYPNPAKNKLYIKNENNVSLQTLTIYNATGKLVMSVPLSNSNDSVNIDINNLSAGIYYYTLVTSEGAIIRDKIAIELY